MLIQHRRAAGQADIDLRHAEHRRLGRHHDVAGRHEAEAGAKGRTIHRSDNRAWRIP